MSLNVDQSFKRLWEVLGQLQLTRDARETLESDLQLLHSTAKDRQEKDNDGA